MLSTSNRLVSGAAFSGAATPGLNGNSSTSTPAVTLALKKKPMRFAATTKADSSGDSAW